MFKTGKQRGLNKILNDLPLASISSSRLFAYCFWHVASVKYERTFKKKKSSTLFKHSSPVRKTKQRAFEEHCMPQPQWNKCPRGQRSRGEMQSAFQRAPPSKGQSEIHRKVEMDKAGIRSSHPDPRKYV